MFEINEYFLIYCENNLFKLRFRTVFLISCNYIMEFSIPFNNKYVYVKSIYHAIKLIFMK